MLTGRTCNALGNLVRILMGNPMGALKESHQPQVGHKAVEILDAAGQPGSQARSCRPQKTRAGTRTIRASGS